MTHVTLRIQSVTTKRLTRGSTSHRCNQVSASFTLNADRRLEFQLTFQSSLLEHQALSFKPLCQQQNHGQLHLHFLCHCRCWGRRRFSRLRAAQERPQGHDPHSQLRKARAAGPPEQWRHSRGGRLRGPGIIMQGTVGIASRVRGGFFLLFGIL